MSDVDRREGNAAQPQTRARIGAEILLVALNCALLVITIVAAVRIASGPSR
jgi:hypothetical protein